MYEILFHQLIPTHPFLSLLTVKCEGKGAAKLRQWYFRKCCLYCSTVSYWLWCQPSPTCCWSPLSVDPELCKPPVLSTAQIIDLLVRGRLLSLSERGGGGLLHLMINTTDWGMMSAGVDCVLWCYWHCRVRIIIKQSPLHGHQLSIIDNYLLHYRGQHFGLISMIIITLFVVCTFCTEINEVHILSWLCEWWSFWRELFNYQLGWSNWIEMPRISVKSVGDWWIEAFKIKFWKPHSRADKLDQISRAIFRRVYTFTLLNALHQKRTPKEGGASG